MVSIVPAFASDNPYLGCPDCNDTGKTINVNLSFVESPDFKVYAFNTVSLSDPNHNPTINANVGDKIVFDVTNAGKSFHAFAITDSATGPGPAIDGTTIGTADNPMKPGATGEVSFVPSKAGEYFYICAVPGHRELGMEGKIEVAASSGGLSSSSNSPVLTVHSELPSYNRGDTVIISGHLVNPYSGQNVFIKITSPSGNVVSASQVSTKSDGGFIEIVSAIGNLWFENGQYAITATSTTNMATSVFQLAGETPNTTQLSNCMQIGGSDVELDKTRYTPNDIVYITVTAPSCNTDPNVVDVIGDGTRGTITIATSSAKLDNYQLIETGPNTGVFAGKVALYETKMTQYYASGKGPTDGMIGTLPTDGISVSFTRTGWGGTVTGSALIRASYNLTQTAGPSNPNANVTTAYNLLHNNNQTTSLSNMSPLSINTDLPSYKSGDTIVTTGHIRDLQNGTSVTLSIYDPNQMIISASQLVPSSDGSFTKNFQASGQLWNNAGTYTIVAQYGKYTQANVTFNYNEQSSTPITMPSLSPTSVFTPTQQDIQNINQAKASQTIAAEVNVGSNQSQTTSIDNNVSVQTTSSTPDSLNVSVSASSQTGPKVIAFNLNATTINVANLKDLGVMYDGKLIQPAPNMDAILHAKPTDNPSFAIVVTQSGVQVLVLVPHFSTHSITITNMSKVIPAVPEFPFAILALMIATFSIVLIPKITHR